MLMRAASARTRLLSAGIAIAVVLAASQPVAAQERRSAGDQALKRAQYMLRLLNQEKSELEAQVAALEEEKSELQDEVEALGEELAATDSRLADSREQIQELIGRIRSDVEKFQALRQRYIETARELQQANRDNSFLVEAVRERDDWIAQCQERNSDLFVAGQEILNRYKTVALAGTEGIFGLKRVEFENEMQELRFRLEDLQVSSYVPTRDILPFVREQTETEEDRVAPANRNTAGG